MRLYTLQLLKTQILSRWEVCLELMRVEGISLQRWVEDRNEVSFYIVSCFELSINSFRSEKITLLTLSSLRDLYDQLSDIH